MGLGLRQEGCSDSEMPEPTRENLDKVRVEGHLVCDRCPQTKREPPTLPNEDVVPPLMNPTARRRLASPLSPW